MNISEIIKKGTLIYTTNTKWSFKSYGCTVHHFETKPMDDLSYVVCSILDSQDNVYDKRSLGVLLGFSLLNTEDARTGLRTYYDVSEEDIFDTLLDRLQDKKLITIDETASTVALTTLGRISLKENTIYTFYESRKDLYEHLNLKSTYETALKMFPFYKDMGVCTPMKIVRKIWPSDDDIEEIIYSRSDQLCKRLDNLSNSSANIYQAEQDNLFDIVTINVPVKLYQYNGTYYPILYNAEVVASRATNLLYLGENNDRLGNIISECLFQKLWNDKSSIFDYDALKPYLNLVDKKELSCDSRTKWKDENLFNFIIEDVSPEIWSDITRYCDYEVLKSHIDMIGDHLDWSIFSNLIDDDYLLDKFADFPWDLESIVHSENHDIKTIEELLLLQKKTQEEWDWEYIAQILPEDFVVDHIDILDVDLSRYTVDTDDVRKKILSNTSKKWDWNKIEKEFDLNFILDNFTLLCDYLELDSLMDRVFTVPELATKYISNKNFVSKLSQAVCDKKKLTYFIANHKKYAWSKGVVELFETLELITWGENDDELGIESNENIKWDIELFGCYNKKVKTAAGFRQISLSIKDIDIVTSNLNFNWDWDALSSNANLVNNEVFLNATSTCLNWTNVIKTVSNIELVEKRQTLKDDLRDNNESWYALSTRADLNFVTTNYTLPWNWKVLTERLYPKLKLSNIGNSKFVDYWDWSYLSAKVPVDFLSHELGRFGKYWDWNIVIPRILPQNKKFDLDFIEPIAVCMTNLVGENSKKAWHAMTMYYSFQELKSIITKTKTIKAFWWDTTYFSNHSEFNLSRDLEECKYYVDWDALSQSETIARQLTYNPDMGLKQKAWDEEINKLFIEKSYHWNFKFLSHINYLCSNPSFVSKFADKIDWEYISKYSIIFCEDDIQTLRNIINRYKKYISFDALSSRNDVVLNEGIIKNFPKESWNYNLLVLYGGLKVEEEFLNDHIDYPWDWANLSSSDNVLLSDKFILSHIEYNWNWQALCERSDLRWCQKLLEAVTLKDVNWRKLSSRENFHLSRKIFDEIPNADFNWGNISQTKGVVHNLERYSDFVDWKIVSKNPYLDISNAEVLDKYKKRLVWRIVCARKDFPIDTKTIEEFKCYIDWEILSSRQDFVIDNEILNLFHDKLDWNKVSASENLRFSQELIDQYKDQWNYPILHQNRAYTNVFSELDKKYKYESNIVSFVERFPTNNPKVYHFTHFYNALKIIDLLSLQSRNLADGNFDNSAGDNVYRTNIVLNNF